MNEEIQFLLEVSEEKMKKAIKHLETEFSKLRAGRANVHILDGIKVDYYGTPSPLSQVSNMNTPDARTIAIQPWEKTMIDPIEKAILAANIGLTPDNNGEIIRLNIPALTEERRKDLVKQVKKEGENTKIGIRNARKEANDDLKKLQKDGAAEDSVKDAEIEVQKLTDIYIKKIDETVDTKENEIMTI